MTLPQKPMVALALAAAFARALYCPSPVDAAGPSVFLTPEHLAEASLHLPSYLAGISEMMDYQAKTITHQELTLEWDSLPGRTGVLNAKDVEGIPLNPNLVVLDRRQKLAGPAGKTQPWVGYGALLVVAITSKKQVRSLRMEADTRETFGEDLRPGYKQERTDVIIPKAILYVRLPDDPMIETVLFFKHGRTASDGSWSLQQVAALPLPPK